MKFFLSFLLINHTPKVISLSPNITEMILDLGFEKNLVGITDYCEIPESLQISRVGGWVNPNWEVILAKNPDLILLTDAQFSILRERITALKIPFEVLPSQRLNDVFESLLRLGKIFHAESKAERTIKALKDSLSRIERILKDKESPFVLIVVDRTPGEIRNVYVAGDENYLDDLLNIVGGKNVASSLGIGYFPISLESLVKLNPEIIFDLSENPVEEWSKIPELEAYITGRIFTIPPSPATHLSTRFIKTLKLFLKYIHPEVKIGNP